MKIIKIDHLPLTDNIFTSNDYISNFIYSAVSDTLFKYDKDYKIRYNACNKYLKEKNKYTFFIREDLYYYNGDKVTAKDYYNSFTYILNNTCYARFLLDTIKKIEVEDNKLIFYLKYEDRFLLDKLTYYSFTPFKDGLTSGTYYICKKDKKSITIKFNKYYRTIRKIKTIKYELSNDYEKDIIEFNNNKINMTNTTTFPLDKIHKEKVHIENSNLIMTIKFNYEFFHKKYKKIRNIINNVIDRKKIIKTLKNIHNVNNTFEVKEENYQQQNISNQKRINLKMGYTDYYPNFIIAKEIKQQLKKHNIHIELLPYELCSTNEYDMYLDIEYSPFNYNEYFFLSKYFKIIHSYFYECLCTKYQKKLKENTYKMIKKIAYNDAKIIPLINFKYIYLCDEDLSKFDNKRMNYYDL